MTDPVSEHPQDGQLLLYLAGEMSPSERRQFEQLLEARADLRRELEELRKIESTVIQGLSSADAGDSTASRMPGIQRQLSQMLAQWQVDRFSRRESAAPQEARFRRVPLWMYPLSAAALVMVCLGVWWLSLDNLPESGPPVVQGSSFVGDPDQPFDLALYDTGSDTFSELERDLSLLEAINETFQ